MIGKTKTRAIILIVMNILVFGSLGSGLSMAEGESDLETLYFPHNSEAIQDRDFMRTTFPDVTANAYNRFSLNDNDKAFNIIFRYQTK